MNNWEYSLIKKISAEKEQERSEDRDNLLRLTSHSLYGEKIHYALELIQNAEDEDSRAITFIFGDDTLSVINDGRPFDEKDVWRICSVRPGEKKKKIGFFGIGFKSVFNITEKPQIISGRFNFEIEKYIYPKAKSTIPENLKQYYSEERGAIFILPYGTMSTPAELIENFNLVDDKILLFLESLKELKFVDNVNNNNWAIKKDLQNGSLLSLVNTRTGHETKWYVFHKVLRVENQKIVPKGKEGIEETRITVAFPLDTSIRDTTKGTGVVYCYLPTKKRTDLSFLIQADFLPTIGRENISDDPWNVWLMKELGTLAADAIDEIKDDEQFGHFLYDFIPLSGEIQDDLIKCLYTSLFEALREKEIAKTTKGWLQPKNCVIPDNDRLRNILAETDLELLLRERVFYIIHDLSEKDHFTRAGNVLFELGAKKIETKEVIDFLQEENEIRKKDKEWFLTLYDYLRTVFDTNEQWKWNEDTKNLYEKLQKNKFILTDDNKFVSLKDPKAPDRLICYPQSIDLSEVHKLFSEGEIVFLHRYFQESSIAHRKEDDAEAEKKRKRVKEWFDNIGVKKYFKQAHIIKEVILPKFTTGKYKEYDDLRLYKLVDYIRTYWSTIESEIKNKKLSSEIIDEIKRSVMLKTFKCEDGNKVDEYRNPGGIYFSKRYGKSEVTEDLFEGIEDIYFLSPYYLNREKREIKKKKRGKQKIEYTWRKFFEILGVWSSPRVVKEEKWASIWDIEKYNWVKKEYSSRGIHEIYGDAYSEDIERLIEHCSKIDDQNEIQTRMTLLWESLEKNWKSYKEKNYCKTRYRWFYFSEQYKEIETSSFLEFLRNAYWVPGKDGGFYRPSEVFTDTKENRLLIGDDAKYVSLKANETFLKDLGVRTEPKIEEVMSHLKAYKEENLLLKENKIEKMSAIYVFLKEKVDSIAESDNKNNKIKEMQEIVSKNELLYLPREDKVWWNPTHVFWKDYSNTFGTLRGYIEHRGTEIYSNVLKGFFLRLGLIEMPSVKECLDILEELRESGDTEPYKVIIRKTYTYLNGIVKQGLIEEADWNRDVFMSEKGRHLKPSELYYSDNDEYREYFGGELEILWLPFSWSNVKELLFAAGFKRLSQDVIVIKKFGDLKEIEGNITHQLIQRLVCVGNYLRKKDVESHSGLQKGGVFQKIRELHAFETQEIVLDYMLKTDNPETIVINDIKKDAYFSVEEMRIYKSSQTNLLSTHVAKEISMLFAPCEDDVFPFLDSLFSTSSDEELNEKLRHFGIRIEDTFLEEPSKAVKVIPITKEAELKPETEGEEKIPEKPVEEIGKKPQLPQPGAEPIRYDLRNPDEFVFDTVEEHTPYIKTEGAPVVPARTVKLREGRPGVIRIEYKPRERVSRRDAEAVALEIVMRFEEIEGREPEDRHKQQAIGYDIYSKTADEEDWFIEVKHFRGDPGTFELQPHQWKKAEIEKDRYFVYVVSGLREGSTPRLDIIQNPVKYLTPDPPAQKKFSDWKNGVITVIKCQKV